MWRLDAVADDVSSPTRLVLAMRSDFLDRVSESWAFTHELMNGLVLLPPR